MTAPTNVTFVQGTTITSEWLNGVNDYVNELDPADHSAANIEYQPAGTGAVATTVQDKLQEYVSVADFGAVGDGVTDDTAAIQAAIDYATSGVPTRGIYFPPNASSQFYKTTAPLVCTKPITLFGDNPRAVTILAVGLSSGQFILDCDNDTSTAYFYTIKDLTFRSNNGSPTAIRLKNTSYVLMKNVQLYNVTNGIDITGSVCFSNFFEQVVGYTISGSTVRFTAFSGGGQYKFDSCTFSGDTGFSFGTDCQTDGLNFIACNFEQCTTSSLYIGGTVHGLSITGCRTEGLNGGSDFLLYPAAGNEICGINISGCMFTTDAGASYPITLGGPGGIVRGFNITGNQVEYAGATSFVKLNGDGESGVISGNYFNLTTTLPADVQRAGVIVFGNENASGKCPEYWGTATWGVEQSTWTPTDNSGAGLTFANAQGFYTKIGNMLFYQVGILYPSTASSSNASIAGLPYNVAAGGVPQGRAGATISLTDSSTLKSALHVVNTKTIDFYDSFSTKTTNANLSGKTIYMSGMYRIA